MQEPEEKIGYILFNKPIVEIVKEKDNKLKAPNIDTSNLLQMDLNVKIRGNKFYEKVFWDTDTNK